MYQKKPGKRSREHDDSGDYRRPTRLTTLEQVVLRLRREIVELGEPSRFKLSAMLEHLGSRLGQIDSDIRDGVLGTISAVIVEQPHKIPLLAGSVVIANSKNETMGQVIVELAHTDMQNALDNGNWTKVKLILRFVVALSSILQPEGVDRTLRDILNLAISLNETNYPAASELYVGVLLALPYLICSIPESEQASATERASTILAETKNFNVRSLDNLSSLVSPFRGEPPAGAPYEPQEFISLVRAALDNLSSTNNRWRLENMLDVPGLIEPVVKDITSTRHSFAALNLPAMPRLDDQSSGVTDSGAASAETVPWTPRIFFQAYLPTQYETVPPVDSFESVLFRDICSDIIGGMDFNRREVTRQLITLDLFFSSVAFADPGIAFDRLSTRAEEDKSTWKVEDVAVEAVLDHIFRLPITPQAEVYYHSILIESCVMAPQALAPVLGRAIRFMYANLDVLDVETFHRFLSWLSHHLSNFNFTWKWNEWTGDLELDPLKPKKAFILNLIQKLERLSYYVRLKETLPEEFLPHLPQVSDDLSLIYMDTENPVKDEVDNLLAVLKKRKEAADLEEEQKERKKESSKTENSNNEDFNGTGTRQEEREKPANEAEDEDAMDASDDLSVALQELRDKAMSSSVGEAASAVGHRLIDIVFGVVCYLGSRSLSHVDTWINHTRGMLKEFIKGGEADEVLAVQSVFSFWKEQPHVGFWTCKLLVHYNVLSPMPLLKYVFTHDTDMNVAQQLPLICSAVGWEAFMWTLDSHPVFLEAATLLNEMESDNDEIKWWIDGYCRVLCRRYRDRVNKYQEELQAMPRLSAYIQ